MKNTYIGILLGLAAQIFSLTASGACALNAAQTRRAEKMAGEWFIREGRPSLAQNKITPVPGTGDSDCGHNQSHDGYYCYLKFRSSNGSLLGANTATEFGGKELYNGEGNVIGCKAVLGNGVVYTIDNVNTRVRLAQPMLSFGEMTLFTFLYSRPVAPRLVPKKKPTLTTSPSNQ